MNFRENIDQIVKIIDNMAKGKVYDEQKASSDIMRLSSIFIEQPHAYNLYKELFKVLFNEDCSIFSFISEILNAELQKNCVDAEIILFSATDSIKDHSPEGLKKEALDPDGFIIKMHLKLNKKIN